MGTNMPQPSCREADAASGRGGWIADTPSCSEGDPLHSASREFGGIPLEYRYSISLRIRHPNADLSSAGKVFDLAPSNAWTAGERRQTPAGTLLEGIRSDSFWTARLLDGQSTSRPLPTALSELVERLRQGAIYLETLAASGGRSELFVGWFFDEGNSGDVLSFELLGRLAELKLDVSFDVYGEAK